MISLPAGYRLPIVLAGTDQVVEYFLPAQLQELRDDSGQSPQPLDRGTLADLAMLPVALRSYRVGSVDVRGMDSDGAPFVLNGRPAEIWNLLGSPLLPVDAQQLSRIRRALGLPEAALRQALSWVGGANPSEAWLIPPPVSAIPTLLADLFAAANRADLSKTALLPLLAYQMLHIHPYSDGNGRTTRLLVWLLGNQWGLSATGVALSTLLTTRQDLVAEQFHRVRLGDTARYLQFVGEAAARWQAAAPAFSSQLQALLHRALEPAPESRRLQLSRALLCFGRLDVPILCAVLGAARSLAEKYLRTLRDAAGWLGVPQNPLGEGIVLSELEQLRVSMAAALVLE